MAVIYLKHEIHGNKVACTFDEAEFDKKRGWVEYTVPAVKAAPEKEEGKSASAANALRQGANPLNVTKQTL